MTVLVDIADHYWMDQQMFMRLLDGGIDESQIRFYPEIGATEDIVMLVCDRLRAGLAKQLSNLALIQKLGAGVETIVYDPDISAKVRIARLRPAVVAMEMAQFCLTCVLQDVYHFKFHKMHQLKNQWMPKEPMQPPDICIAVLGLGHIGGTTAKLFQSLAFHVIGWSRTEKSITGVDCRWGLETINSVLAEADYVIGLLPATAETINLFDRSRFNVMKSDSTLINVGRGSLIVEQDLLDALEHDCLAHAILDVVRQEPLSIDSPLWQHPKITITPHVSGWHLDNLQTLVDNYNALIEGTPLCHEISREHGY